MCVRVCARARTVLDDSRRLNVAVTRARFSLLVVGDIKVLRQKSRLWRRLTDYIRSRGAVIELASVKVCAAI